MDVFPLVLVGLLVHLSRNCCYTEAGAPPRIIQSEQRSYRKNVGQNVKLHCRATGAQDDTNNRTLFFWKNQFGLIRQNRLRWPRYDIRQNQFLKIRNIQPEDAGVYICTATNEFGSDYAKRILKVYKDGKEFVPKKPKTKKKPTRRPLPAHAVKFMEGKSSSIRVVFGKRSRPVKTRIVGENVKLKCMVQKTEPPLHVLWRKDGKPLNENSRIRYTDHLRVLHLKHLSEEDSGNYTCTFPHLNGLLNQTFMLIVRNLFKYQPSDIPFEKIQTTVGGNFTLTCETRAQRKRGMPSVRFQRSPASQKGSLFKAPVQRGQNRIAQRRLKDVRTHWRFNSNKNGKVLVSLTFFNVTRKDSGNYICITGKSESARNVKSIAVIVVDPSGQNDQIPEENQINGKRRKANSSKSNKNIPMFLFIIVPVVAGIICVSFVLVCWRRHKKKEKIARNSRPCIPKHSEHDPRVTNGHISRDIGNGSLNSLPNGLHRTSNGAALTVMHHGPATRTSLHISHHSEAGT